MNIRYPIYEGVYRILTEIRRKRIPLALIPAWNDALRQWKKACNEQIVIRQSTL